MTDISNNDTFQSRPKQLYAVVAKPQPITPSISTITATNTTIMNRHGSKQVSGVTINTRNTSSPVSSSSGPNITKKDIKRRPKSIIISEALDDNQNDLNSEELKFLYTLFVPNRYRNKPSLKQLVNHLPRIIPIPTSKEQQEEDIQYDLNFQVHLFLSTIMVKYVNSWYFTKLNTNNIEFVHLVYQLICDFIQDFSKRINEIIQHDKILELIDEIADILNNHLQKLISEPNSEYAYKIVNDYYQQTKVKNSFKSSDIPSEEIISEYLQAEHIIFQETGQSYFRVLVKQILTTTFESEYSSNLATSEIANNLVILLMSDLVLDKLVDKLSTPDFILVTIVNNIVTKLLKLTQNKPAQTNTNWSVKQVLNSSYQKISDFIINISYGTKKIILNTQEQECKFNIFDNSILQLIDTLTNMSERKPLFTNLLVFIRNWLQINEHLNKKLNSIWSRYLVNKLKNLLTDNWMSTIISDLREKLFYQEKSEQELVPTINDITDKFIQLYKVKYFGNLSRFNQETEEQQRKCIKRILSIFNSVNISNTIETSSTKMNKLLLIRILDCLIANIYPELASRD